jgi:hypothetical protein
MSKEYLGDGVYANAEGDTIVLTTEDGIRVRDRIYLEPEVLQNLEKYIARRRAET